jgi:hypothetical protein
MFKISDTMIYTLRSEACVRKWFETPDPIVFRERIAWRTGRRMLDDATAAGAVLPIVFGDAGDTRPDLLAIALVRNIEIEDSETSCTIGLLRPLTPGHMPSEISLAQAPRRGQAISPDDIRPYRLCLTPPFVVAALKGMRTADEIA